MYFDLGFLRIGETSIPLEEDIHTASLIRLRSKTLLKPQTATLCFGKVKNTSGFPDSKFCSVSAVDTNFIGSEPGLMVSNSLAKLGKGRTIPIMVVNHTNQTIRLSKGCVIAKIEPVENDKVRDISSVVKQNVQGETCDWITDVDVPEKYRSSVVNFLRKHGDLLASKDSELGQLGHTKTVKMKINTQGHPRIKLRPYRTPINSREVVDKAVDEMLEANVIRRSNSPWSFPVVIVDKKDGSKRFCVDFRKLNQITKPNSYPLPLIDDILALLGKAKHFTSFDLKSGYWQVLMDESDKEKTAFACHRGLFEFNVMPFGLTSAPAVNSCLLVYKALVILPRHILMIY